MKQPIDIQRLVDRFFDGDTTLDKEQQLYDYFRTHEVDAEEKALQQMFLDLHAIDHRQPVLQPTVPTPRRPLRVAHWLAAAAVFVGLLVSVMIWQQRQDTCVAYVYGQKVTNREQVMHEVHQTMSTLTADNPQVDQELKGLFE